MAVSSMTFDESYYLTQNPDVLTAVLNGTFANAREHFDLVGFKELRDPNANFDVSYYLTANTDVLNAGVNAFDHFLSNGVSENRAPTEALAAAGAGGFDETTYLTNNTDVQAAVTAGTFVSGYQHWVLIGQYEGRPNAQTTSGTDLTSLGASSTTSVNTGSTFTLTSDLDSLTGTSANDTFTGSNATYTTGDAIAGGAGTDILNLTTVAAEADLVDVSGVEQVFVRNTSNGQDINATGWSGVEQLWYDRGSDDLKLSNVASLATVGIKAGDDTNSDFTVEYAASVVSGSSDAQVVVLSGSDAHDLTIAGVESVTVQSITSANKLDDLITAAATSVTITGDQDLTIDSGFSATVKTVDASAATGKISVVVDEAADVAVTGGTANDTLNLASANFTSKDSVDGGEGTDTLFISGTTTIGTAADLSVSNVEIIKVGESDLTGAAAFNVDGITGVTSVTVGGTNVDNDSHAFTLTDLATTATTINFTGDGTDDNQYFEGLVADYDTTTALDAVSVNISNGGKEGKDVEIHEINLNNVKGVTVTATDVGTASGEILTITDMDVNDAESLTLVSNSDVVFTNAITGGANLETVDFSGADANVTATLNVLKANAIITLGDGNDSFTSTETDQLTINAGAGNDTIDLGTNTTGNTITTGTGADTVKLVGNETDIAHTITDFTVGSGGDVIDFDTSAATGTVSGTETIAGGAAVTLNTATGLVIYQGNDLSAATAAGVEDLFDGTQANLELAANDDILYLVASDGTNAYLFYVEDDGSNQEITAAEDSVTLIATFSGVTSLADMNANNFADFL